MKSFTRINLVVLVVAALTALTTVSYSYAVVSIETVTIGNPGNADDVHGDGYGGVDYTYNIGKHEVTNTEYSAFLTAVDPTGANAFVLHHASQEITFGGGSYTANSGFEQKPVGYVNFWDATRFANWLHNGQGSGGTDNGAYTLTAAGIANNTITRNAGWKWAIASEDEWYKAAYYDPSGPVYYTWATGSDTAPTVEGPPGTDLTNGSANNGLVGAGGPNDVGSYDAKPSDSPYGTFDQTGNVWEWNDTIDNSNPDKRGMRGADYTHGSIWGNAETRPNWIALNDREDKLGFRVTQIPEPGSISVLGCGLLGLGLGLCPWRKRRR